MTILFNINNRYETPPKMAYQRPSLTRNCLFNSWHQRFQFLCRARGGSSTRPYQRACEAAFNSVDIAGQYFDARSFYFRHQRFTVLVCIDGGEGVLRG